MRVPARFVLYSYRPPLTPARVLRLARAPSLEDAVTGKVALVTGASSGIGRATALRLGAAGATVLLVARRVEALEEAQVKIRAGGGQAHVHPCDLRDHQAIRQLTAEVSARYGAIDILVNDAGRSIRRPIDQAYDRLHDFERTIQLNYIAAVHLTLALIGPMRERGSGHIINVSTWGTLLRGPMWSAYTASKAALDAFSRCIASEVRADGVHLTTVHFPLVHTPMTLPSGIFEGRPGLTADDAAGMIAEAIRTRPARVVPRVAAVYELAWWLAPTLVEARFSRMYRRSVPLAPGDAAPDVGEQSRALR
jgi:NAD(P)-dependent dehydrogenase (short-subunit alcohol dehydrogenase family)